MQQMVYTPEELERIQMGVLALLCYAKRHDRRELPRCFLFCRTMVKNIDLCREGGHTPEDRAELSQCIREDWKCAMEAHAGLPEYYLPDARLEVQRSSHRLSDRHGGPPDFSPGNGESRGSLLGRGQPPAVLIQMQGKIEIRRKRACPSQESRPGTC